MVSGTESKTCYKCIPDRVERTLVLRRGETLRQLLPVTDTETPEPAGHRARRCPAGDAGERQRGGMGGRLLRDADRGRHRKSSGHHFQSACQPRWGGTAGFALSFAGMRLPRAKRWLAPPGVRRPSPTQTTDVTSSTPRALLLHVPPLLLPSQQEGHARPRRLSTDLPAAQQRRSAEVGMSLTD